MGSRLLRVLVTTVVAIMGPITVALGAAGPVPAPPASAGPSVSVTPLDWSPTSLDPVTANNSTLASVSCVDDFCLATGSHLGRWTEGYAERWTGSAWATTAAPAPARLEADTPVDCVSATFCVRGRQLWNGSSWTPFPGNPDPRIEEITCVSSTWCIGVGTTEPFAGDYYLSSTWDGTRWTSQTFGGPDWASLWTDIECVSPSFCFAGIVNYASMATAVSWPMVWDGTTWSRVGGAWTGTITGLGCADATECFLTGVITEPDSGSILGSATDRWDGTSITQTHDGHFAGISCVAHGDCFAVNQTTLSHWDGIRWSIVANPPAPAPDSLQDIACTASGCLAVGPVTGTGTSVSYRYDGTSFTRVPTLNPGNAVVALTQVACIPGTTECEALATMTTPAGTAPTFLKNFGTSVQASALPTAMVHADLACLRPYGCVTVGRVTTTSGLRPRAATEYAGWKVHPLGLPPGATSGELSAVSCTTSLCTAVGSWLATVGGRTVAQPLVAQSDGTTWTRVSQSVPSTMTDLRLTAVSCTSGVCWAGGSAKVNGVVRAVAGPWSGTGFAVEVLPSWGGASTTTVSGLSCTQRLCVVVGSMKVAGVSSAYVAGRTSTGWRLNTVPTAATLTSVACVAPGACRIVGSKDGHFIAVAGRPGQWALEAATGPLGEAWDVSCLSAERCEAVGGRRGGAWLNGVAPVAG